MTTWKYRMYGWPLVLENVGLQLDWNMISKTVTVVISMRVRVGGPGAWEPGRTEGGKGMGGRTRKYRRWEFQVH